MTINPTHHIYNIQLIKNVFRWNLFISKFSIAAPSIAPLAPPLTIRKIPLRIMSQWPWLHPSSLRGTRDQQVYVFIQCGLGCSLPSPNQSLSVHCTTMKSQHLLIGQWIFHGLSMASIQGTSFWQFQSGIYPFPLCWRVTPSSIAIRSFTNSVHAQQFYHPRALSLTISLHLESRFCWMGTSFTPIAIKQMSLPWRFGVFMHLLWFSSG